MESKMATLQDVVNAYCNINEENCSEIVNLLKNTCNIALNNFLNNMVNSTSFDIESFRFYLLEYAKEELREFTEYPNSYTIEDRITIALSLKALSTQEGIEYEIDNYLNDKNNSNEYLIFMINNFLNES